MPRKHARPAAKKEAARKKKRLQAKPKKDRRVMVIGHAASGTAGLALAAMAAGLFGSDEKKD